MTTQEQALVRYRLRQLDEEAQVQSTLALLKRENAWVKGLVLRVAKAIWKIGR
jgi:hypothetical protein